MILGSSSVYNVNYCIFGYYCYITCIYVVNGLMLCVNLLIDNGVPFQVINSRYDMFYEVL